MTKKLNWKTIHNTSERVMTHYFESGRVLVMTNFNTGIAYIQKDGSNIDHIDVSTMGIEEYTNLLSGLAKDDAVLNEFKTECHER